MPVWPEENEAVLQESMKDNEEGLLMASEPLTLVYFVTHKSGFCGMPWILIM